MQHEIQEYVGMSVTWITGLDPVVLFKDEAGATIFQDQIPNVGINPNSRDADETNDLVKWFGDRGFAVRLIETEYSPQPASSATFAGRRYEFYTEENRRDLALLHANARGGRLLSVETPEEADFVGKMFLKDSSSGAWLAASDYGWEGNWKWEAGPLTGQRFYTEENGGSAIDGHYAPWNEGEPNNARGVEEEDCAVAVWNAERNAVTFNDVPCYKRFVLVVEFDDMANVEDTPKADDTSSADETCKADGTCTTDEASTKDEAPKMRLNEEL